MNLLLKSCETSLTGDIGFDLVQRGDVGYICDDGVPHGSVVGPVSKLYDTIYRAECERAKDMVWC